MASTTAPRPIQLGIIGTGLAIEKLHWPALRRLTDRFRVVAFANHTRPKAEAFAALAGLSMDAYHADYRELLARADVEAVLIALPIPLNLAATRDGLAAGKHVICEKPAGADAEQARAFLALPGQFPERVILIAENFFYRDDLRLARSLLDAGAVGRPHLLAWRMVNQLVPRAGDYSGTAWRQHATYRGGPHLDAGVHHIAQLRLLAGDVRRLSALVQDANPTMGGPSDLALGLEFAGGAIGSYTAVHAAIPTPDEPNDQRVYGTEGVLTVGRFQVSIARPDGTTETHRVEGADGGYSNELLNFHDAIVHGEPVVGDVAQSVRTAEVIFAALDAAEAGRAMTLTEQPGWSAAGVPLWRPRGGAGLFDGLPTRVVTETRPA